MMSNHYHSWGRFPKITPQHVYSPHWLHQPLPSWDHGKTLLPFGLGRSYGDVCLNEGGILLNTRHLNRFIAFDVARGLLRCEAGVSLAEILAHCVPQGWFLPITPGTQFVTVGGAIANDVHGKNHHQAGSFGNHVLGFELLRSDGQRLLCSPTTESHYYNATIGGLGLTGLITWAELQLKPIAHRALQAETVKFAHLEEFFELSQHSDHYFEYTVAWIDCSAQGERLGRGLFFQGNHIQKADVPPQWRIPSRHYVMPVDLPGFVLNPWTVKTFNTLYYHQQKTKTVRKLIDYRPFFYPLDNILSWNRLYGKQGFLQYQLVIPAEDQRMITLILETIAASGLSSFLAVLKKFGTIASPGLLSFPRPGVTLALDFPIKGAQTFELLDYLDDIVSEVGGAVYPAKDARLSPRHFQSFYPQWEQFAQYIDPQFSSSFWRRVTRAYP